MGFALTMDQELIRRTVREFAERELEPKAAGLDLHRTFPAENIRKMAPLGLLGLLLPPEEGGAGGDTVSFCLAAEEIARSCASSAFEMVVANTLVAHTLIHHAPAGLKGEWLPRVVAGEAFGALAHAEEGVARPEKLRTVAVREKSGYRLAGSKRMVANVPGAHFLLVAARLPEEDNGTGLFLVPTNAEGVKMGEAPGTLGLRAVPLGDVHLLDVRVPLGNRLAEEEPDALRESWALAKLGAAAISVGLAQAGLDRAVRFATERQQFGRPVGRFEAVQQMLGEMGLETMAARALLLSAAGLRDEGREWMAETDAARLKAAEVATRATKLAIKVHGGAGFMRELPVERYARDARTLNHFAESLDDARAGLGRRLLGLEPGR